MLLLCCQRSGGASWWTTLKATRSVKLYVIGMNNSIPKFEICAINSNIFRIYTCKYNIHEFFFAVIDFNIFCINYDDYDQLDIISRPSCCKI